MKGIKEQKDNLKLATKQTHANDSLLKESSSSSFDDLGRALRQTQYFVYSLIASVNVTESYERVRHPNIIWSDSYDEGW